MKFLKSLKDKIEFFYIMAVSYISNMFKADDEMNG